MRTIVCMRPCVCFWCLVGSPATWEKERKPERDSHENVVTSRYIPAERDDRLEGSNECCPIDADLYLALP